jgi:hypothetical protein
MQGFVNREKMKKVIYLMFVVLLLTGCRSSRHVASGSDAIKYLSAKMQIVAPLKSGSVTLSGTVRLKSSDRVQLSVLMPILRSELFRLEVSSESCIVLDRMNKQYVLLSKAEMGSLLPSGFSYEKLEALLIKSAAAAERYELTGKDMGLPKLEKAKVTVYDIADGEFDMQPTTVPGKYTQVSAADLLKLLNVAQ